MLNSLIFPVFQSNVHHMESLFELISLPRIRVKTFRRTFFFDFTNTGTCVVPVHPSDSDRSSEIFTRHSLYN